MLRAASLLAACAVSCSSFAALTAMQGVGIVADGAYLKPGFAPSAWNIAFTFDGDTSASATSADFGTWSFSVSNGSQMWSTSGDGSVGGRWTSSAGARIFTIDLTQAGSGSSGSTLAPAPTSVSIIYTAVKIGGTWCSLGEALQRSQGSSFDAMRGGFVVRTGVTGSPDAGTITSGYAVPAPGAAALVGLASVIAQRRRR